MSEPPLRTRMTLRANEICIKRDYSNHVDAVLGMDNEITRLRAEVERLERRNRMHDTVNRDQAESYEKRLEAVEQKAAELLAEIEALDAFVLYTESDEYCNVIWAEERDKIVAKHKALNLQHKPTETDLTTKD